MVTQEITTCILDLWESNANWYLTTRWEECVIKWNSILCRFKAHKNLILLFHSERVFRFVCVFILPVLHSFLQFSLSMWHLILSASISLFSVCSSMVMLIMNSSQFLFLLEKALFHFHFILWRIFLLGIEFFVSCPSGSLNWILAISMCPQYGLSWYNWLGQITVSFQISYLQSKEDYF